MTTNTAPDMPEQAPVESREEIGGEAEPRQTAPRFEKLAHRARGEGRHAVERARRALKKPAVGAAAAGGAVLFAAGLWGASEAAVGALAAYGVYRLLRGRNGAREDRSESIGR
jgi:hypothetical protein